MPPRKKPINSTTKNSKGKRKRSNSSEEEFSSSTESITNDEIKSEKSKRRKSSLRSESPESTCETKKSKVNNRTRSMSSEPEPSTSKKSSTNVEIKENMLNTRSKTTAQNSEKIYTQIAHLNPFQTDWIIKARVTVKRHLYSYKNSKGEGKVFSFDLIDSSAEIRVTVFQQLIDRFYDKLKEGTVYEISGADVKNANKKYSSIKNNFELIVNNDTKIEECIDDLRAIPNLTYNITPISKITKSLKDQLITVTGICHQISSLEEFTSKSSGIELKKKNITLIDKNMNGMLFGNKVLFNYFH